MGQVVCGRRQFFEVGKFDCGGGHSVLGEGEVFGRDEIDSGGDDTILDIDVAVFDCVESYGVDGAFSGSSV